MRRMTVEQPETKSTAGVTENIQRLRDLFPEACIDGRIDISVLQQLLGEMVEGREEKFGLSWHGKQRAGQLSLTPSTGTLRPSREESVNWETTQNLMIEGDNLEVLKLLQKSYAAKIKLIYIDPPYNTGRDFLYSDNFRDNVGNYLELTGQLDGKGRKLSSKMEASGRFHTDWLNMMYPRLKLARGLLRGDGIIFVSIDDHELHHLRSLMGEIFGEENFMGTFVWRRRTGAMDSSNNVSTDHEYVVCYARRAISLNGISRTFERYSNPDDDPRGPWIADNLSAAKPGGDTYYPVYDPDTGFEYYPPAGRFWPYSPATMRRKIAEGRIIFPGTAGGSPLLKRFRSEAKSLVCPVSTWLLPSGGKGAFRENKALPRVGLTSEGTKTIKELFGEKAFTYAKPVSLIRALVQQATSSKGGDIVLDFFAGSGTTAHAMWEQNAADGGDRRVILVQLPEPLDPAVTEQKTAAKVCDDLAIPRTIAELTKERLRRAAAHVQSGAPSFRGDLGFRVFKLDTSNIHPWPPNAGDLEQILIENVEHLPPDRSESDILFELLLELGLDLCVPIERKTISGKTVHSIGGGVLLVCMAEQIAREDVEPLARGIVRWHQALAPARESEVVFRDSAFADDVAKINLTALLQQHGLESIRSL